MAPNAMAHPTEQRRTKLQALLLADSFTQNFRPITIESPKVLMPLCGVPLIDYALEWLEASGVEETYVFCCAHSDAVLGHLRENWSLTETQQDDNTRDGAGMKIVPIVSTGCVSAGEAMRSVYEEGVISSDFVLMTGDTVSSMNLKDVLGQHLARRKTDKSSIMTMVVKRSWSRAQRRRLGDPDVVLQIDPQTNQLLSYEDNPRKGSINLDVSSCFAERSQIAIREDMVDCYIDICAPEVLGLFQDNFDYQHLRRDFVAGVLSEEELGNKIFLHELESSGAEYVARVSTPRSYDAISKDVWNHWLWPIEVGQSLAFSSCINDSGIVRRGTHDVMRDAGVRASRSVCVGNDCQIGQGTSIEDGADIATSFVGKGCRVGRGARVHGSHLFDRVDIGEGARVSSSMLASGVRVEAGAVIQEGCIIGPGVVVGADATVPAYSRLSLYMQVENESDSEEELEYVAVQQRPAGGEGAGDADGVASAAAQEGFGDADVVGKRGRGFSWKYRNSVELSEFRRNSISGRGAQLEALRDGDPEHEGYAGGESGDFLDEDDASAGDAEWDPEQSFHNEVRETFLRCVQEKFDQTNALIELNALKIAEDRTFADCARFIFTTIVGLCFPAPPSVTEDYRSLYNPAKSHDMGDPQARAAMLKELRGLLNEWGSLLQRFLKNEDDQVELLLTFEEYCSDDGVFSQENGMGGKCANAFCQVLQLLYDCDVISEDAILAWAEEKGNADDSEKLFLEKAQPFLAWLREAESDYSDSDESD